MLIEFPSSPQSAAPRKRGAQSDQQKKEHIVSYYPALLDDVELDIVRTWKRGVSIAWVAKIYRILIRETEAIIWVRDTEAGRRWLIDRRIGRAA